MTLAMALILIGLALVYAGIRGRSITSLLTGKLEPSKRPTSAQR